MFKNAVVNWVGFYLALLSIFVPFAVAARTPSEEIRFTTDKVLTILKDPKLKSKPAERRQKLREAIYPRFDFEEMAKRSLGSHWRDRTAGERKEFVELFRELMEAAYLDTLESYESEKIKHQGEKVDGEFAQVNTMIVGDKGREYSVNYRLRGSDGSWQVYDVVIEGVSLVNNYRSQFSRVLSKSSYPELVEKMKAKQVQNSRQADAK